MPEANYKRPAFTGSNWKPLPKRVTDRADDRVDAKADNALRKAVREYWSYKCRVCFRKTSTVHEHKRRGAGGEVSLSNSFLACDHMDGGVCHPLLQRREIVPVCHGKEFDARKIKRFEMPRAIAKLVFENRPIPEHIRIVKGVR